MRNPRSGVAVLFLGVSALVLWAIAMYGTYEDKQRGKYEVSIKPGAVVYGTHSTATMPSVAIPMHRASVPMVSSSAIHEYAYYGHASMPTTAPTGRGLYTTSSAKVHTIGSGGGNGGGGMISGGSSSSSRGVSHSGGSISMPSLPSLAMNTSSLATQTYAAEATTPHAIGPRKAHQEGGEWYGDEDGEYKEGYGIWDEEEGTWRDPEDGDSYTDESGNVYEYRGTYPSGSWVWISGPGDPGVPVGATPWLMMLALAAAYTTRRVIKHRKLQNNE